MLAGRKTSCQNSGVMSGVGGTEQLSNTSQWDEVWAAALFMWLRPFLKQPNHWLVFDSCLIPPTPDITAEFLQLVFLPANNNIT